jgi:putative membrane protein
MRGFAISTVVTAIALGVTVVVVPGLKITGDNEAVALLVVAVVFGLVNGLVRPVVKLLSLPLTLMTMGLFTFVINGLMVLLSAWLSTSVGFGLVVDSFPPDFSLGALWIAILTSIVLTIVRAVVDLVVPDRGRR